MVNFLYVESMTRLYKDSKILQGRHLKIRLSFCILNANIQALNNSVFILIITSVPLKFGRC